MAWRYKVSKFKNTTPIVPKTDRWIRDLSIGSFQVHGRNVAASAKFLVFNWDASGNSLAVLPLNDCGRKSKSIPLIFAHTDTVCDIDFSPFDDHLFVTGSQDCTVKVWTVPENGLEKSISEPELSFANNKRRVETVGFHPTVDFCVHATSGCTFNVYDLIAGKCLRTESNEHTDIIQSVSWHPEGGLCASTCRDRKLRILDARCEKFGQQSTASHQNITDSRCVWLGDSGRILTTGFDASKMRQVFVRDLRNFGKVEKTLEFSCSTGVLIPLYDVDTRLVFLAGKGDTSITLWEWQDKEPFLIEGLKHSGEQTKNVCLVPKRALNFMQAEVARVLQLTSNSIVPISYQIPRKTYRDFHADLYADIYEPKSNVMPELWFRQTNDAIDNTIGVNARRKIPIDPNQRIEIYRGPLQTSIANRKKVIENYLNGNCPDNWNGSSQVQKPQRSQADEVDKPRLGPKPFSTSATVTTTQTTPNATINEKFRTPISTKNINESQSAASSASPAPQPSSLPAETNGNHFDRNQPQRNSIAERRRLYEQLEQQKTAAVETSAFTAPLPLQSPIASRRRDFQQPQSLTKSQTARNPINELLSQSSECSNGSTVTNGTARGTGTVVKQQSLDMTPKRTQTVFGRVSKFRHLKGTVAHKSQCLENVRNISLQVPGECDGFHANAERVAVPLSGQGGKIAIFELSRTGRLADGVIPSLVNGSNVCDFQWDPFCTRRLAVACDDGTVRIWRVEPGGLVEPTNVPQLQFTAHADKIYFVKFNPAAEDVLATGGADFRVKIWNLNELQTPRIVLDGHTDVIFHFAWSQCGNYAATVCKDARVRVYKPRAPSLASAAMPVQEGAALAGSRGARLVWALGSHFLILIGFDRVSERQIVIFNVNNLKAPLNSVSLDVSPSILVPFYDEDSSTLFATGKGDSTVYAFEIANEYPYICPLSHHRCSTLHQGLSFLAKNACDVANVEFAKALRLTSTSIEPLSFTVPRVKSDFFQDDLFPATRVTWKSAVTADQWFQSNISVHFAYVSLKPDGMESLSSQSTSNGQHVNNTGSYGQNGQKNDNTGLKNDSNNGFVQKPSKNSMIESLKRAFDNMPQIDDDNKNESDSNSDDWS